MIGKIFVKSENGKRTLEYTDRTEFFDKKVMMSQIAEETNVHIVNEKRPNCTIIYETDLGTDSYQFKTREKK